jgi:hypothetical protein
MANGWKRVQWWRALAPDGTSWAESSNEEEVRRLARPDDTIQQLHRFVREVWRDA